MAFGGRAISVAAASLGNAALASAPERGGEGGYSNDGTPRCRHLYFATLTSILAGQHGRLANAAGAPQLNTPLDHVHGVSTLGVHTPHTDTSASTLDASGCMWAPVNYLAETLRRSRPRRNDDLRCNADGQNPPSFFRPRPHAYAASAGH
eukprot:364528-Chlamydomonas_euryale.AAC.1